MILPKLGKNVPTVLSNNLLPLCKKLYSEGHRPASPRDQLEFVELSLSSLTYESEIFPELELEVYLKGMSKKEPAVYLKHPHDQVFFDMRWLEQWDHYYKGFAINFLDYFCNQSLVYVASPFNFIAEIESITETEELEIEDFDNCYEEFGFKYSKKHLYEYYPSCISDHFDSDDWSDPYLKECFDAFFGHRSPLETFEGWSIEHDYRATCFCYTTFGTNHQPVVETHQEQTWQHANEITDPYIQKVFIYEDNSQVTTVIDQITSQLSCTDQFYLHFKNSKPSKNAIERCKRIVNVA